MPVNQNTGKRPVAFWNADYDPDTDTYSNITFAQLGDGVYNMFSMEYCLNAFLRKIFMVGSKHRWLQSADAHEVGQNMRIKLTFMTRNTDHAWKAGLTAVLHREKTVTFE
jgi:hypothetical protein